MIIIAMFSVAHVLVARGYNYIAYKYVYCAYNVGDVKTDPRELGEVYCISPLASSETPLGIVSFH